MAKKSMKDAATSGLSVIDTIATGNTQSTEDVSRTYDAYYAKGVKDTKPTTRINIQMPTELHAWCKKAAYLQSNEYHTVSVTEYIVNLIKADKEKNDK